MPPLGLSAVKLKSRRTPPGGGIGRFSLDILIGSPLSTVEGPRNGQSGDAFNVGALTHEAFRHLAHSLLLGATSRGGDTSWVHCAIQIATFCTDEPLAPKAAASQQRCSKAAACFISIYR